MHTRDFAARITTHRRRPLGDRHREEYVGRDRDGRDGDRLESRGQSLSRSRRSFPLTSSPGSAWNRREYASKWLSYKDPLDKIDDAAVGARLLAISYVQFMSGFRADLEAIGAICGRRGVIFFVDAIQGLGAFPLDVNKCKIHALAADGHKWMLGPEGCGILYVRRDVQDLIEPVEFGWTNIANFADYANRDMRLRPDAGRYECGTLNTIGIFGLRAAIQLLLEVGIERIRPVVQGLGDRIHAGVKARGYEPMQERTPTNGAESSAFGITISTAVWSSASCVTTESKRPLAKAGFGCHPTSISIPLRSTA